MTEVNAGFLQNAQLKDGRVARFSNEAPGLSTLTTRTLTTGAGLVPLLAHGVLRVTGADRLDFVHGQVTNEVKRLKTAERRRALMLNHKGHALAQMQVLKRADELLLVVEGGAVAAVKAQLKAHIIFDQVVLEPQLGLISFTLQGAQAESVLRDVFGAVSTGQTFSELELENQTVLFYPSRRSLTGGFDLLVPETLADKLVTKLVAANATLVGEAALLNARVAAGIPLVESEGGEGVLPQEAGLESAVSYTKGCYLGQEIMARIEARGRLRRALSGVTLSGEPDASDKTVTLDGKKVGRLGAVTNHPELGWIGLAVLRNDLADGAELKVASTSAKLSGLPFGKQTKSS